MENPNRSPDRCPFCGGEVKLAKLSQSPSLLHYGLTVPLELWACLFKGHTFFVHADDSKPA